MVVIELLYPLICPHKIHNEALYSCVILQAIICNMQCVGIDAVIGNINRTPLESILFTATKPPVVIKPKPFVLTNDIKLSNLSADKCSTKALHKYFTSKKKSGISAYKNIKVLNKTTATLYYTIK